MKPTDPTISKSSSPDINRGQKPPDVSVVMSSFNDASTIGAAICSIQAQTLKSWELIVIDDGSTDGTNQILQRFAEGDDRVRVIRQQNAGLTRALIGGCAKAGALYIARHDADDRSHPERLERQLRFLEGDLRLGFVTSWTDSFTPDGAILDRYRIRRDPELSTHQLLHDRQGPPAHGSVMMRKSVYDLVGGYRECFYFGQDSDLWMRMAENSLYGIVNDVLYFFLRSPNRISGKHRSIQQQFGELGQQCRQARSRGEDESSFLLIAKLLTEQINRSSHVDSTETRSEIAMCYLIGSQLAINRNLNARKYLYKVLRHQPWHWKAWVRLAQSLVSGEKQEARNEEQQSC